MMPTPVRALSRSIRAEAVRLGGLRGPLSRITLPLGLALPVLLSLGIGVAAESLHSSEGLIQVREVSTANSIYWVIYLGVTVHAVVSAYAQASSQRGEAGELERRLVPSPVASLFGRWVVTASAGAVCSFLACLLLLTALPAFFPEVYGHVRAASPEGVRFLWSVPVHCVSACAVGAGLGALLRSPAAVAAVFPLWALFLESALVFLPYGARLTGWMPFLNGVYGTGQEIPLEPLWGRDFALLYVVLIGMMFIAAGAVSLRWQHRR